MIYENDHFIVYYNECDKKYLGKLLNVLNQRVPNILNFFKIQCPKKVIIKLYDNLDEYKDNIMMSFKNAYLSGNVIRKDNFKIG